MNYECEKCPYGASCLNGTAEVQVLQNFWGFLEEKDNTTLYPVFPICPFGYCCQHRTCYPYNYCNGNREGILCGSCKDGYGEEFGTYVCRNSQECNQKWQDWIFWPLVLFLGILFAAWLLYSPPIFSFIASWLFIISNSDDKTNTGTTFGYKKIIFYFYQIADFILLANTYDLVEGYVRYILGFSNFGINSPEGICPYGFQSMDAVTKTLANCLIPTIILFAIILLFAVSHFFPTRFKAKV
jgi:hypothetical protein